MARYKDNTRRQTRQYKERKKETNKQKGNVKTDCGKKEDMKTRGKNEWNRNKNNN